MFSSSICSALLVCLISLQCINTSCQLSQTSTTTAAETTSSAPTLVNLDSSMEAMFNFTYHSRLLYRLKEQIDSYGHSNAHVSHSCLSLLQTMLNSPTKHRWSLSMLDANAPLPSSLLWDQLSSVGGYGQCLGVSGMHNEMPIHGKYCLLDMRVDQRVQLHTEPEWQMENFIGRLQYINKRFPLILGLCFPSTCSAEEINYLIQEHLKAKFPLPILKTKVDHCQSSKDFLGPDKSVYQLLKENNIVVSVAILGAATGLMLLGTVVDAISSSSEKEFTPNGLSFTSVLICFSVIRSTTILFGLKSQSQATENAVSVKKEPDNIEKRFAYLHGVRSILILWIIVAHSSSLMPASIIMPVAVISRHPHDIMQMTENNGILGVFFSNGTLAVEAFFLISGLLLVAMIISKNLQNKVNFVQFVFLRWIRFAPTFLATILAQKAAVLFGSGPFFSKSLLNASILKKCGDADWWKAFLFINNWSDLSDTCLPITWFISVDMQIHIIAFGLVVLLRKRLNKLLFVYCIFMILLSIGLPVSVLLSGVPTFSAIDLFSRYDKYSLTAYVYLYTATYVHLGAYFSGALIGYAVVRGRNLFPSQLSQTITWWASLTVVLVIPLLNNPPPDAVGHIVTGLSVGFQHGFWLLGLGLMFYILSLTETNPHALPVKRFLSSSLFRPVSRLSFCIYLTHMTLIWFNVYAVKAPLEVNTTNITLFVCGVVLQTVILSYLIFIVFECPSVNLMKLIFSYDKLAKSVNPNPLAMSDEERKLQNKAIMIQLMQNRDDQHLESLSDTYVAMNIPKIVIQSSEEENNNQKEANNLNSTGL